jgi:fibronectin-binding autotransporter adhesin
MICSSQSGSPRLRASLLFGFLALFGFGWSSIVVAGDSSWAVGNGDWNESNNWTAGVPSGSGTAYIQNGGKAGISDTPPSITAISIGQGSDVGITGGFVQAGAIYAGDGTAGQSGGQVQIGFLSAGTTAGFSGTYSLNGGTLETTGTPSIGDYGTGVFNLSGGTAQFDSGLQIGLNGTGTFQQSGGTATTSGQVHVGIFNTGVLNVNDTNGPALFTSGDILYVGQNTTGQLIQSGAASAEIRAPTVYLGVNSGGVGQYSIFGNATFNVTSTDLIVGYVGSGSANINGGTINVASTFGVGYLGGTGSVVQTAGTITANGRTIVGNLLAPGSTAAYHLTGGTLNSGNYLYVGLDAAGTFTQDDGIVSATIFTVLGLDGYGAGNYTMNGGTLNAGGGDAANQWGSLIVGWNGPNYTGIVHNNTFTQNGGTVNLGFWLVVAEGYGSLGTYNLNGGVLNGGATSLRVGWSGTGVFNQTGGIVNAGNLHMGVGGGGNSGTYNLSGGSLNLSDSVYGGPSYANGTSTLNLDGGTLTVGNGLVAVNYLNIGNAAGSSGFHTTASGQTTTVNNGMSIGRAGAGVFTQNGGTLGTPNLALGVIASGNGTYQLNGGSLNLLGGAINFGAGTGAFLDQGGAIVNLAGINFGTGTGSLSVGTGQTLAVPSITDPAHTGAITVASGATLSSPSPIDIESLNLNGGIVTTSSIQMRSGLIHGNALIHGALIQAGGTISPGNSAGIVTIDGNYTLRAAGQLQIELAGTLSGTQYDQLLITGSATLDGTLQVSLLGGFAPVSGDSFDLLTTTSGVTGTFANQQLPTLAGGLVWNLSYGPNDVILSVGGVLGDYNHNNVVDAADYVVWRKGLGTTYTQNDYNIWRAHFDQFAGSGLGALASAAVPEPQAGILVLIGIVSVLTWARSPRSKLIKS